MAKPARKIEDEAPELPAIVDQVAADPLIVLTDAERRVTFLEQIEVHFSGIAGTSVASQDERDRIKSAAYQVARYKTAIDDAGKKQTEEWRRQTAEVNAQRNEVKVSLEAIQARIRKPVTLWEEREADRKKEADALIARLEQAMIVTIAETSADVQARLDEIRSINLNPEVLGVRTEMATDLRDQAVKDLYGAVDHLKMIERERAEAARLRAEAEAREADDLRRRQEADRAADEKRRALEAEEQRRQAEADAAERARAEERLAAERRAFELDQQRQAEIHEANERARKAEEAAEAERRRVADERRAAEAAEEARLAEQRRREADRAHRSQIMGEAKADIMSCGADEATAKAIVTAIVAGQIAHTNIRF